MFTVVARHVSGIADDVGDRQAHRLSLGHAASHRCLIREAARRVERDVKAVHGDVTAPLEADVLDRGEDGRIEFQYQAVRVDFLLEAA